MQAITKGDLLTIIEDVGFGSAVIADKDGIVIDGLASMAKRLDRLVERRLRRKLRAANGHASGSSAGIGT